VKKMAKIIKREGKNFRIQKVRIYAFRTVKEEVEFYLGWGWLTREELFNLRQTDPRIAP
jgi:hypothetical protein